MKIVLYILIFLLVSIIITQWMGIVWNNKTIVISHQPKNIQYNSFDSYTLRIIKQQQTLNYRHTLIVSKDVEPNYGYVINYPENQIFQEDSIKIVWSEKNIIITTNFDTKIVIPKKGFTSGR